MSEEIQKAVEDEVIENPKVSEDLLKAASDPKEAVRVFQDLLALKRDANYEAKKTRKENSELKKQLDALQQSIEEQKKQAEMADMSEVERLKSEYESLKHNVAEKTSMYEQLLAERNAKDMQLFLLKSGVSANEMDVASVLVRQAMESSGDEFDQEAYISELKEKKPYLFQSSPVTKPAETGLPVPPSPLRDIANASNGYKLNLIPGDRDEQDKYKNYRKNPKYGLTDASYNR